MDVETNFPNAAPYPIPIQIEKSVFSNMFGIGCEGTKGLKK